MCLNHNGPIRRPVDPSSDPYEWAYALFCVAVLVGLALYGAMK